MTPVVIRAVRENADFYRQFSRNGRWGTCVDCPRDVDHNAYPEFCVHTDRYDHQLNAVQLADNYMTSLHHNERTHLTA